MNVIDFIITYFVSKNMFMMNAFICWPPEQINQLWRNASSFGVRLSVYTDFRRPPRFSPNEQLREAMLLDVECPDKEYLLEKASASRGFHYRHSWLLLHHSSNRSIIEDSLKDYVILPDADVVWASPDRLVDVYRTKANQPLLLTDLGVNRGFNRRQLSELWATLPTTVSRRRDLRNVTLTGAHIITLPEFFRGWNDLSMRHIDTLPKVIHPLMMTIARDLNFRFNLRQADLYGAKGPNGSFNGMVGMIQRNEVEIGLASIFMRKDRMEVIHYFAETLAMTCAFIFRQPSRSAVSNVFLAPFSSGVWSACGVVSISAAVLLVILRGVLERAHHVNRDQLKPLTLPDTCTFALGSMCQQGFYTTPSVSSIRVVMFSTLMASMFVLTAYSAKIVTLLQTPSDAMRTLDDLTRSPMTIGVQETTYKKVYFIESADMSAQQLYKRKILPQGERAYMDVAEGIERVRTELFAFQVERWSGYEVITKTFTEREKCSLDEIEAFKTPMVSGVIKRYSGYRELFAVRMRWQREAGLMGQVQRVWLAARPRCEAAAASGFVSIGIVDVLPAIQVLSLGAFVSVVLLISEVGMHAFEVKRARHSKRFDVHTAKVGDKRTE